MKYVLIVLIAFPSLTSCRNSDSQGQKQDPTNASEKKYNGYVSNEETAKKIAEAIWLPIYGSSIMDERPYKAKIVGDSVWIVEGTLQAGKYGGTAYIEIRMNDCKILNVTHGK
jgi:hypothetical protein